MDIWIDGVPHNQTIKRMAKQAKRTDIVIIHRLRCLGIKGFKVPARILYTDAQAKQLADWDDMSTS